MDDQHKNQEQSTSTDLNKTGDSVDHKTGEQSDNKTCLKITKLELEEDTTDVNVSKGKNVA